MINRRDIIITKKIKGSYLLFFKLYYPTIKTIYRINGFLKKTGTNEINKINNKK